MAYERASPLKRATDRQIDLAVQNVIQYRVRARRGDESSTWSDQLAVDFTGGQDSIAGFVGGDEEVAEAA